MFGAGEGLDSTDASYPCSAEQTLALSTGSTYVPRCRSHNSTLYDPCQCDTGNTELLGICWCADEWGNQLEGQVHQFDPNDEHFSDICLNKLACDGTEVTAPPATNSLSQSITGVSDEERRILYNSRNSNARSEAADEDDKNVDEILGAVSAMLAQQQQNADRSASEQNDMHEMLAVEQESMHEMMAMVGLSVVALLGVMCLVVACWVAYSTGTRIGVTKYQGVVQSDTAQCV